MRRLLCGSLVIFVGCGDDGGGGGSGTPMDAAPDVAKPIDAAPVWIDAPPAPAGHTHFVIDQQLVP